MKNINYRDLSLSELSFIVLTKSGSVSSQMIAMEEIKRRFKNNRLCYDKFMEYEKIVIEKRGRDIRNYLISKNVDLQQVMEVYINCVLGKKKLHRNILFSEGHLCNSSSNGTFFGKVMDFEIGNLITRIVNDDISMSQLKRLRYVRDALVKQKEQMTSCWYENSVVGFVSDISEDRLGIVVDSSLYKVDGFSRENYSLVKRFIKEDNKKLIVQKKRILRDVKNNKKINYSFIKGIGLDK